LPADSSGGAPQQGTATRHGDGYQARLGFRRTGTSPSQRVLTWTARAWVPTYRAVRAIRGLRMPLPDR